MSFEMRMKFPSISLYKCGDVHGECQRLRGAGWKIQEDLGVDTVSFTISREIQRLYLAEVHWGQRFLSLEPTEISVVFENSVFPEPVWSQARDSHHRATSGHWEWERFESDLFPGFWYEMSASSLQKTLEVRVFDGQQLGKENWKKFLLTLSSIYAVTKVARHLHQFRMVAVTQSESNWKRNVQEMDRHYNEILETLGHYLPR